MCCIVWQTFRRDEQMDNPSAINLVADRRNMKVRCALQTITTEWQIDIFKKGGSLLNDVDKRCEFLTKTVVFRLAGCLFHFRYIPDGMWLLLAVFSCKEMMPTASCQNRHRPFLDGCYATHVVCFSPNVHRNRQKKRIRQIRFFCLLSYLKGDL